MLVTVKLGDRHVKIHYAIALLLFLLGEKKYKVNMKVGTDLT